MRYVAGVDGGGTNTTVGLADEHGNEILRRLGSAGLVDPRDPTASAETVAALVRGAAREAGIEGGLAAVSAGLAGVGNPAERAAVEEALRQSGIAEQVNVISDGEIALEGALGDRAGILLLAGTGSVAYGRGPDGRVERCGGWGMIIGDEGSGYMIGRSALIAAVRAEDGRGQYTRLLPTLLEVLDLPDADALPPWVGRAPKADVAALTVHVIRLAREGDAIAHSVLEAAMRDLALHAAALVRRLGPWPEPPYVVRYGGVLRDPLVQDLLAGALDELVPEAIVSEAESDAVTGALRYARRFIQAGVP